MISYKIVMKELENGQVAVAFEDDQQGATKGEVTVAIVIKRVLECANQIIMEEAAGTVVVGEGLKGIVRQFIKKHSE